tara:strand:- start:97 stop:732 length:636 start_codon:yes stop_codon:yes gene_type:complete
MITKKYTKPQYWEEAKAFLIKNDKVLMKVITETDDNKYLQRTCTGFETLANAIIGQQISILAANSIAEKIKKNIGKINRGNINSASTAKLKNSGLSHRKILYLKDLARLACNKPNYFSNLNKLDDDHVISELCKLYGIGEWTAQMYLMFQMLRPNILPMGDVGFINSMKKVYNLSQDAEKRIIKITSNWNPYTTVGVWYIWRVTDPEVVQY